MKKVLSNKNLTLDLEFKAPESGDLALEGFPRPVGLSSERYLEFIKLTKRVSPQTFAREIERSCKTAPRVPFIL